MKKWRLMPILLLTVIMIFLSSGKTEADSINYPSYVPFFQKWDQEITPGTKASFRFDAFPGETTGAERFCARVSAWIEYETGDGTGYFEEISSITREITSSSYQVIMVEWETERLGPEEYLIEAWTEFYYDLADVWIPCPDTQREFVIYAKNYCGEKCTWKIRNDILIISGEGPMTDFGWNSEPWTNDRFYRVVVNEGVTDIGSYAFYGGFLYNVTLPATLKSIGEGAFASCKNLGAITIPDSVNRIGADAFEGCDALENVTLPEGLTEIPGGCFQKCRALKKIVVPEAVRTIQGDAFSSSGLQDIWVPAGLEMIQSCAFGYCYDLETVYIYGGTLDAIIEEYDNEYFLEAEMVRVNYWLKIDSRWCYIDMDGRRVKSQFKEIDGEKYYFNDSGYMVTGWQEIDGKWYYFNTSGIMQTGWVKNSGYWYLLGQDGAMQTGWQKSSGKWYYFNASGIMQTGWVKDGGKWYLLGSDGVMQTGWQKSSGKWYYFNASGIMQTGWVKDGGKWYLLGPDGVMKTGWQKDSNQWYYFESGGAMATGWLNLDGKYYYLGTDGAMRTDWQKIKDVWYFFKPSGIMAAKEWYNGYYLNANGSWTYQYKASWKQDSKGWWFGDESGWYAKNCTITINDKQYTFDAKGYMK